MFESTSQTRIRDAIRAGHSARSRIFVDGLSRLLRRR